MAERRPGQKRSRPGPARSAAARRRGNWWSGPVPWLLIVAGLVVVGAAAAIAYAASAPRASGSAAATSPPASAAPASPGQVGEPQPVQEGVHIQPPQKASYQSDPPSSGP